ncbi:MAG: transcription elongation factor Spt5, partial [Candidatus Ranarchaeia archaeon]
AKEEKKEVEAKEEKKEVEAKEEKKEVEAKEEKKEVEAKEEKKEVEAPEKDQHPTQIFAIRTTTGQERSVALLIAEKAEGLGLNIKAVLAPETAKGYIYVEAPSQNDVLGAIKGIRHVRGKILGMVPFTQIEHYLTPRSSTEDLSVGDFVEIIGGPFKGEKAKVTQIINNKEEVVLQLLESTYPIPIRVHGDYIKIIEKAEKELSIL